MESNEILRQIFDTIASIKARGEESATLEELVLIERITDLDDCLSSGGSFPDRWTRGKD